MLLRLLRVICGMVLVLTIPIGFVVFSILYIITGNTYQDNVLNWIMDDD